MSNDFTLTSPDIRKQAGFQEASLGIAYYTLDGRLTDANPAFSSMFGYSLEEMQKRDIREITHPDDVHKFDHMQEKLANDPTQSKSFEVRCYNHAGELIYLRMLFCSMRDEQGKPSYIMAVVENLTPQLANIEERALIQKLFETIANHVPSTVWLTNADFSEVLFVNKSFCNLWEMQLDEILGKKGSSVIQRIHPDDQDGVSNSLREAIKHGGRWDYTFRLQRKDGTVRHVEDHGTLIRDEKDKVQYLLGTQRDVTEQIEYMEKLEALNSQLQRAYAKVKRLSEYDSLTNCLNRAAMMERLSDAMYQYQRYEIPSTLIYIDLNGFKQVNDKYGHHAGDQVLKTFVEKVQATIRQTDLFGRIGGDEFLLLFPGATHLSAEQFMRKNNKFFTAEIDIPNKKTVSISLRYSAGIAELDFRHDSVDAWVDQADREMYVDKISSQ